MSSRTKTGLKIGLSVLALSLGAVSWPAFAGFDEGLKAYESGDFETALKEWLPLAEKGDPAVMRNVGHLYRWGRGVDRDPAAAAAWYRKAADLGFSRAQANLASLYLIGEGVDQDPREAAIWFERAAHQNLALAQYQLGMLYEAGIGVEKNEAKAMGWFNLAARQGMQEAVDRLSLLVGRSPSVKEDAPDLRAAPQISKPATVVAASPAPAPAPAKVPASAPASAPPARTTAAAEPTQLRPAANQTTIPQPPARIAPQAAEANVTAPPPASVSQAAMLAAAPAEVKSPELVAKAAEPQAAPQDRVEVKEVAKVEAAKVEAAKVEPAKVEAKPEPEKPIVAANVGTPAKAADDEKPGFFGRLFSWGGSDKIATPVSPAPAAAPASATPSGTQVAAAQVQSAPAAVSAPAQISAPAPAPALPTAEERIAAGNAAVAMHNYQNALAQWLPLARGGDPRAQMLIGQLYANGQGVPRDPARAHMWWSLASAQGNGAATSAISEIAANMTPQQLAEAARLLRAAQAAN